MAILPLSTDYTDKDHEALVARMRALIESVFPEWTVTSAANFGNLLVELFCFVGDVLTYYQDNQALESQISTARLRRSLLNLVKLIGYRPAGATASQATVTISIPAPTAGDVVIPAETIIRSRAVLVSAKYRTLSAAQIDAGLTSVDVLTENSEPQEQSAESTGVADQEVVLTATPFLDGSASVVADNGTFTEVDDFLDSLPTDTHFTVTVDEFDQATLRFGSGINGLIPSGTMTVTYRTGGGTGGQVDAGTLTVVDGSFTDTLSNPVTLSATNTTASTPAQDRETVEEIRAQAPRSLRALTRSVTREDFEAGALEVPGVSRALMLTSDELVGIAENTGHLYVVTTTLQEADAALLDDVLERVTVTRPSVLTFNVVPISAPLVTVDVSTVIHLAEGADPATTKADIVDNLAEYFSVTVNPDRVTDGLRQVDFGFYLAQSLETNESEIPISDIQDEIQRVTGVRKIDDRSDGVTMNGARQDLAIALNAFPVLGTVTVIDIDTGAIL